MQVDRTFSPAGGEDGRRPLAPVAGRGRRHQQASGIFSVFLVLGLLAALALALASGPTATAQGGERRQGSLCQEHRGDPGWASVCREARRR
jgi:hypothetical protein